MYVLGGREAMAGYETGKASWGYVVRNNGKEFDLYLANNQS